MKPRPKKRRVLAALHAIKRVVSPKKRRPKQPEPRAARTVRHHPRIVRPTLSDHLGVMTRAVFQAGLSWAVIDAQWARLCDAFDGFDPTTVAAYDQVEIDRVMGHPDIVHSERKIRATIDNARTLLALDREHKGVYNYLRSHKTYPALALDLKRRFKYLGDVSAYYYVFRVGERVPPFARWIKTVKGDHPRVREMVNGSKT